MGYKYQNRLDEEREHSYWAQAPWWKKLLYRVFMAFAVIAAIYNGIGWFIVKIAHYFGV